MSFFLVTPHYKGFSDSKSTCLLNLINIEYYLFTECPSTTGKSSMHDVHIINLSLPHEIKILADKKEAISPPSSLNITRVSSYEITQYISIGQNKTTNLSN